MCDQAYFVNKTQSAYTGSLYKLEWIRAYNLLFWAIIYRQWSQRCESFNRVQLHLFRTSGNPYLCGCFFVVDSGLSLVGRLRIKLNQSLFLMAKHHTQGLFPENHLFPLRSRLPLKLLLCFEYYQGKLHIIVMMLYVHPHIKGRFDEISRMKCQVYHCEKYKAFFSASL